MQGMDVGTGLSFYVVCVSRTRIGLDVIYVHVGTAYFGAMHTGICPRTAHTPFVKNVNHVGLPVIYIKHAPLFHI